MGKGVGLNGVISTVKADELQQRLFVSGNFNGASGMGTSNIAYMDAIGWHSMGSGIAGLATAIEVTTTDVFVAGNYMKVIDNPEIMNIARWDGTSWHSLGGGISGGVITKMAFFQDKLFVIGSFTKAGDSTVNGSAVWDGSNWSSFTNNSSAQKTDLFVHNNSLYLFTMQEEILPNYNHTIYQYNGSDFDSIAGSILYESYLGETFINDTLIFVTRTGVYSFDWNLWKTKYILPENIALSGLFNLNDSLYFIIDSIFCSIRLFKDSSLTLPIVEFLPYSSSNFNTYTNGYDVLNNAAYIGGNFAYANNTQCLSLCKFNGVTPSSVGWFAGYSGQNPNVLSSYFDSDNNNLYVAGTFTYANDSMAFGIARWDGNTWHPMGNGLDGVVYSVIEYNGVIYAGGNFTSSGTDTVHYIARWDGTKWHEVAGGANAYIRCMSIHNNQLIAAGWFTSIGGISASYIAQYNGTSWSALPGNSLLGAVHTMKEINGTLYAGGYGTIYSNSTTAKYVTNWSGMGSSKNINSFGWFNDHLYMSTSEPQIYKWENEWTSLGLPSFWDWEAYSQVFVLDGNLCASAQNNGFYRFENGSWNNLLSLNTYSTSKMNDSTYFLGGFFPYAYTSIGNLPLNNTAIFISSKPNATIEINKNAICTHNYIFYTGSSNDPFLKYQWHFPGGFTDTSTQYNPVVLYDSQGTYAAYAMISNWNGVDTIYLQDSILVVVCPNPNSPSFDNVWMLGYGYSQYLPKPGLDFYYGNPDTMGFYSPMEFYGFSASICDTNGILQLYTNGEQIANSHNEIVDGSKNFNDDEFFEDNFYNYSPFLQCALILPYPDHSNQYYIIHTSPRESDDNTFLAPFQLWYSIVDMNLNNGEGKMTAKQQPILYDTLTFSNMQAERHANGRDWWIIIHKYNSDKFYVMLLTPDGVSQMNLVSAGPVVKTAGFGQSVFSPDGKTFALCANDSSVVHIFHFDRCEGNLTYSHSMKFDYESMGGSAWGCAFSPNNQYLYVSTFLNLYQIDTACWTVESCRQLIGEYDGYGDPISTQFFRMRLAPDDKIYMTPWNGTKHFHVINDPDSEGAASNFVQHQLKLTSYNSITIPEFPNFRVGALEGSVCDTIIYSSLVPLFSPPEIYKINLEIIPNPSIGVTFFNASNAGNHATLRIFNSSLQMVLDHHFLNSSVSFTIDVSSWNSDIYFCEILNESGFAWKKFIVQ